MRKISAICNIPNDLSKKVYDPNKQFNDIINTKSSDPNSIISIYTRLF